MISFWWHVLLMTFIGIFDAFTEIRLVSGTTEWWTGSSKWQCHDGLKDEIVEYSPESPRVPCQMFYWS